MTMVGREVTLPCVDWPLTGSVSINWKMKPLRVDHWKLVLSANERQQFSGAASKASMRLVDSNFQKTGDFSLLFVPKMEDKGHYSCLIKQQEKKLREKIILLAVLTGIELWSCTQNRLPLQYVHIHVINRCDGIDKNILCKSFPMPTLFDTIRSDCSSNIPHVFYLFYRSSYFLPPTSSPVSIFPSATLPQYSTLRLMAEVSPAYAVSEVTWLSPGGTPLRLARRSWGVVAKLPQILPTDQGVYICQVYPRGNSSNPMFPFTVDLRVDGEI